MYLELYSKLVAIPHRWQYQLLVAMPHRWHYQTSPVALPNPPVALPLPFSRASVALMKEHAGLCDYTVSLPGFDIVPEHLAGNSLFRELRSTSL